MENSFETGGAYLLRLRRVFGCLSLPTFFGVLMLVFAADNLGATVLAVSLVFIVGTILFKVITTSSDGVLRIDERGIWIEQQLTPIAAPKKKTHKTLVAWSQIESIDVGYGRPSKQTVEPEHIPIEAERLLRKPSFMTHMSRKDWSLIVKVNPGEPVHIYATNMNDGQATGTAIGLALWSRNLIGKDTQATKQSEE